MAASDQQAAAAAPASRPAGRRRRCLAFAGVIALLMAASFTVWKTEGAAFDMYLSSVLSAAAATATAATALGSNESLAQRPTIRRRKRLTPFEQHYLSVYKSMMIDKTVPPKFVLWRMHTHGFGNKIRSLNGAMFAAAITGRVMLIDSPSFTSLFDPPILDGVTLDWNYRIATSAGMCDTNATSSNTILLNTRPKNADFADDFANFTARYDNVTCLVASASHGHDRQIASYNERTYKEKVEELFGHSTSRYNWCRHILGLAMQRVKPEGKAVLKESMDRLGLLGVAPERRIGIHIRTFFDMGAPPRQQHEETSTGANKPSKFRLSTNDWPRYVLDKRALMLDCVHSLIGHRIDEIRRRRSRNTTLSATEEDASLSVLFVSDNMEMKEYAKRNITTSFPSVNFVDSGLDVVHTGDMASKVKSTTAKDEDNLLKRSDFDAFLEWLLLGECSMLIATGFSSYGLTSSFRPGTNPHQPTYTYEEEGWPKALFTIDRLVLFKPKFLNMENKACGRVEPEGYADINFGIADAMHKQSFIDEFLNPDKGHVERGGVIKGLITMGN